MKKLHMADSIALASLVIFTALFIGFFFWVHSWKFNLPGPDAGMAAGIAFVFFYGLLFIASILLTSGLFSARKKITEKWIRWGAFLPVALTVGTPLGFILVEAMEPSMDTQRHKLICELRSSEQLSNARVEFIHTGGASMGPLKDPKELGGSYFYDIDELIYKEKERRIEITADGCKTVFKIDAPAMPRPMPFSEWQAPTVIESKAKIELGIRYRVEKN